VFILLKSSWNVEIMISRLILTLQRFIPTTTMPERGTRKKRRMIMKGDVCCPKMEPKRRSELDIKKFKQICALLSKFV